MVNLNENKNYLKNYDSISEDVKFAANSIIRLKILAALYEKPQNIKELSQNTRLNYSSISGILHDLELKEFVYRESNRYYLVNSIHTQMANVLELKEVVNLLNNFFNILDGHIVDMIPEDSVAELYLLGKANLLESGGVDAYKIYNFIEQALQEADKVSCIVPFYHVSFNQQFNKLVEKGKFVEVIACEDVYARYKAESDVKFLSSFKGKNNFLLIVTDKIMILGLFKEDESFDQNRLLTSKNSDSLIWATNLLKNFKKRINEF